MDFSTPDNPAFFKGASTCPKGTARLAKGVSHSALQNVCLFFDNTGGKKPIISFLKVSVLW
jgi:hypothetical protein